MKISSHTIIVDDYPTPGEHLLYSTRTQALVKIDRSLKTALEALVKKNEIPPSQSENLKQLYQMGLIVRDDREEREKLKYFLNQLKYGYKQSHFVATILTTYACNFKCVYCFEESSRENVKLDFSTQEFVISWLKRRIERLGYTGVLLNYYGGEPLLNPPAIEHISGEMQRWCRERDIRFGMSIQTNGYLMTPALIDNLNRFSLKRVRISIDGTKENHDANRPLRGGGSTFDKIIQNIRDCIDKTPICVSVGYNKDNIDHVEKLMDHFKDLGILHRMEEFICSPIHPTVGPKGNPQAIQGSDCMCNHEDRTLASATRKINVLMIKNGFPTKSGMGANACSLVRENSGVTIDQHGRIYRCNSLLGHPEFALGDVRNDEFNDTQREFRDLDVWKQCPVDCTYLPMCSGGCRLMSFVGGHKNFKVASCKKPYLNEMAAEFIKRDYDKMVAGRKKLEQKKSEHAAV